MEPWEAHLWCRSTFISYGAAFVFMVSDIILGPEDAEPMHNVVIFIIFSNLLSLPLHIHNQKTTPGSANLRNSFSSALVNFSKPQGVIFGWIILLLQHHRVPAGPYLFGALISGVISAFCAVMLLRPVVTDMGIMYTLCSLSIGVSVRDHHLDQSTWITFGFCCFLVYARIYLEHTAERQAAEEVAAAAERQHAEEVVAAAERLAAAERQAAEKIVAAEEVVAAAERQAAEKIVAAEEVVAAAERQAAEKIVAAEEVVAAAEKVVAAAERQAAEKIVAAEEVVAAAERQAAEKIVAAEEVVAAAERQAAEKIVAAEKVVAAAERQAAEKDVAAGKEAGKEIVSTEKEAAAAAAASDGQEIAAV